VCLVLHFSLHFCFSYLQDTVFSFFIALNRNTPCLSGM
jgi:hypothetical protein